MAETSDPAGRRANGLPAAQWGALVDLDPRLSDGLLDRLARAGVPAYVEPASAVDTVHRAVTMPARPLDRLWVDPSRADRAREIVATEVAELTALLAEDDPGTTAYGLVHPVPASASPRVLPPPALPGPSVPSPGGRPGTGPALSDDDVFAQIVAGFNQVSTDPAPPWPAAEDLPVKDPLRRRRGDAQGPYPAGPVAGGPGAGGPDVASARPAQDRTGDSPGPPAGGTDPTGLPSWLEPAELEDEDHYMPPPPPPVPRLRLRTAGAVVAIVLGLLVMFVPSAVGLAQTREVGVLGIALLAGGAGALVWWMRDRADDGPDDGAVV